MTKSNLETHLKWLLDQGPSLYPALTPLAWESHVKPNNSQNNPAPKLNLIASHTEDLSIKDSQPAFPATVDQGDDVFEADSDTDMARLMLAPPSASKPRMLSCTQESPGSVWNTSRIATLPQTSPEREATQTPRSKKVKESPSVPSSFRDPKERITTPIRPKRKLDIPSSTTDIDTIDLTDDFDRIKPSSETGEEFDEPRRLWTEDAASRGEPADKRGKKRKSDEYTSDLLSTGDHGRRARSPFDPDRSLQSDQNISTSPPRSASKDEIPPSRKKKQTLPSTKRAVKAIAIPDSDDESVDGLFEGLTETKHSSPRISHRSLYPVLPVEKHSNTPGLSPGLKQREPISPDSIDMPKTTRSTSISESNATSSSSRALPPPSCSAPKPSTQPMDKDVEMFLQIPSDSVSRLTAHMRNIIQKNSAIVYDKSMNGEYAPELVSENGNIQTQIRAIENLNTQKSIYLSREAESKSLKCAIMQAIGQGVDPATLPEFEQQIKITSQMKEIQSDLCRLLQETNLFASLDKYSLETSAPDPAGMESLSCTMPVPSIPFPSIRDYGDRHFTKSPVASGSLAKHSLAPPACDAKASHLTASKPGTNSVSTSFKDGPRSAQFEYDEPMASDEETTFTRTMGAPLPPINDTDDFDVDVFDEDMLEMADYLQDDRPSSTKRPESHSRPVFAETTGNSIRSPATQKSQTHGTIWGQHPWTKDVKNVLKERFHLRGFRLNQLEAIDSTLRGKDTFVLMPTGGGKSLCYQLPSVVSTGSTKGVTIVISPLLSLMHDQVSHLRRNKIKAYLVNGETPREERQWIMGILSSSAPEKQIELLYITPEMVSKSHAIMDRLEDLNRKQRLARIVIDEAHCVSQWGHDFRPDYKELGRFRARIPGVPMMALTATATENVKVDVIHNLKMEGCDVFTQSFNRPNLTYEVRPKGKSADLLESIAETITGSYRNKSGIVYCLARKNCEKVAETLRKNYRIKAAHYHAGLDAEERAQTQQKWQAGEIHVIVATIAFGMGIDKPDVRFVIHHSIPKSLEGYYQETGRAGRDGRRSGCYLYFAYNDVKSVERMINNNSDASDAQKTRQRKMLRNVVQYCENQSDCRRVQILAYFSESFQRQDCNASCDNCKSGGTFEVRDFSEHATAAIRIVRYFQDRDEKVTLSYCVNILRGTTKSFRSPEHRHAPYFGDGADIELGDAERLFRKLLGEKALAEENIMNQRNFPIQYIKLGFRAADFESGTRRLRLDVRLSPNGNSRQRGTAGRDDLPQSTNVSSPVQSANRRRLARYRHTNTVEGECDSDRDSDGFERIRVAGKNEPKGKNLPGPPITQDHRYDQLDPLHKTVAEDFMVYAKNYCQDVVMQKGLRNQPFTDTILREMVMIFPQDKSAMLRIPDIDPDKVHRYGDKILKLVRDTQRRYNELKKERDDVDGVIPDPNHHNVVNISSDDEFSDFDDDFMDQASTLHGDNSVVTSQYFSRSQQPFEDDSGDDYHPSPKAGSSKPQKRKTTKRTRRKSTDQKPRTKGPRNTKTHNRSEGRSLARKESKAKPKQPTSQIAMMPI